MSRLIFLAIPFFIITVVGEAWLRRRRGMAVDRSDDVTSGALGLGNLLVNFAFKGLQLAMAVVLYEHRCSTSAS